MSNVVRKPQVKGLIQCKSLIVNNPVLWQAANGPNIWLIHYTADHIHKSKCQAQGCHSAALDVMSYSITKFKQPASKDCCGGRSWLATCYPQLLGCELLMFLCVTALCPYPFLTMFSSPSFLSFHFSPEIQETSCVASSPAFNEQLKCLEYPLHLQDCTRFTVQ